MSGSLNGWRAYNAWQVNSTTVSVAVCNFSPIWFANIYLHELDWFAKHTLRIKKYMRYNDDIMVIGLREDDVRAWVAALRAYAARELLLEIPDHKVLVIALPRPIDILGLCTNGDQQWLRYTTRRRAEKMWRVRLPKIRHTSWSKYVPTTRLASM